MQHLRVSPFSDIQIPFGILLILDAYSVQINNARPRYIMIVLGTRLKMG